ncbi:inner membrane protein YhjD [Arthrobacter monumenti]
MSLHKRREIAKVRRQRKGSLAVSLATMMWFLARINTVKPMRAFQVYTRRHGPLMAAGISYNMFFAVTAMLVAGFSILGLVVVGNRGLQQLIVDGVSQQVPNLIDTGSGGLVTPEQLFDTDGALSITLIISTATMLLTALRWIGSLREGMRGIFDLLPLQGNPVQVKVKDFGTLLILAVAMVVTFSVGVLANTVLGAMIDLLNLGALAKYLTMIAGTLVTLVLDMVVAVIMFRLASGIRMPRTVMFQTSLLAAIGSTVLRTFSTQLLGTAGSNPLLASFAVILGLFVWFYLLSQVYLYATAWGVVGTADTIAAHRESSNGRLPSLRQRARLAARGG